MGSSIIGAVVSVLVGGAVAAVTVVGLINAQTKPPQESPVNVSDVRIQYGSN